jgi:DNA polymerase III subunit delta
VAAELKPVYLILGGDRPKVELALRRLRGHFAHDAIERLDASQTSGADAVAVCNALGLFGGDGRLVLVEAAEAWKDADEKEIAAYLAEPTPGTVLALVGEGVRRDAALAKTCAKAGEVLIYDVVKKRLPEWVQSRFQAAGVAADRDACRSLVDLVGEDVHALATEVDKLATWAAGAAVSVRDVERLVTPLADTPPWSLTDAWGKRDVARALGAVESALDRSGEARSTTVARLIGALTSHVALVRACQRFEAEGLSPQAAAARLKKRSTFPVEKAYGQASRFSVDELRDAVVRLAELDHALKGGSRLAGDLELERALVDVTRDV